MDKPHFMTVVIEGIFVQISNLILGMFESWSVVVIVAVLVPVVQMIFYCGLACTFLSTSASASASASASICASASASASASSSASALAPRVTNEQVIQTTPGAPSARELEMKALYFEPLYLIVLQQIFCHTVMKPQALPSTSTC